jgi:hypothetical protein
MGSEWLRMSANWLLNSFRQPTVCSLALRLDNGAELAGCQQHFLASCSHSLLLTRRAGTLSHRHSSIWAIKHSASLMASV